MVEAARRGLSGSSPSWGCFCNGRKGRVEGRLTCRGGSLGSGAQLSGCKRRLSEWFVLLRLILGAAPGARGGSCEPGPRVWEEKGASASELRVGSPDCPCPTQRPVPVGAVQAGRGWDPCSSPAATHPQLWLNGQGRGAGSPWRFLFSVLSSGKVRSQDAEPPGTVTWQKRVREWASSWQGQGTGRVTLGEGEAGLPSSTSGALSRSTSHPSSRGGGEWARWPGGLACAGSEEKPRWAPCPWPRQAGSPGPQADGELFLQCRQSDTRGRQLPPRAGQDRAIPSPGPPRGLGPLGEPTRLPAAGQEVAGGRLGGSLHIT